METTHEVAERMHDLLNLFSGLYSYRDFGKGDVLQIRNKELADSVIAEASALLNLSKDDALHILVTKANHKITYGQSGMVFTYDKSLLPSHVQE